MKTLVVFKKGDKVKFEDKKYLIHSFDKSSNTLYLSNEDGKLAEDYRGNALQVHESKIKLV